MEFPAQEEGELALHWRTGPLTNVAMKFVEGVHTFNEFQGKSDTPGRWFEVEACIVLHTCHAFQSAGRGFL